MILTDYNLPDGSGIQVAWLARLAHRECPIIGMSGNLDAKRYFFEAEVIVFLEKPFGVEEVLEVVRRWR